jgi:hypothetical protein
LASRPPTASASSTRSSNNIRWMVESMRWTSASSEPVFQLRAGAPERLGTRPVERGWSVVPAWSIEAGWSVEPG